MPRNLNPSTRENEKPGIFFNNVGLYPSQFTEEDFEKVCGLVGMKRESIIQVMKAYDHNVQLMEGSRRSGEPNWHHPVGVALVEMLEFDNNDPERIVAALMHDSVEDSNFFTKDGQSLVDLTDFYGERVAKIVMAVTKPESSDSKSDMSLEVRHNYLQAKLNKVVESYPEVAQDACELKIADRIFNLRTEFEEDRLIQKLKDTVDYLFPIIEIADPKYQLAIRELCDQLKY